MACIENPLVFEISTQRSPRADGVQKPLPFELLSSERTFYNRYPWSLNVYPTVQEAIGHLRCELNSFTEAREPWQLSEMMTNVFLLSSAIANELDDYLAGKRYDFSNAARLPFGRLAVTVADKTVERMRKVREDYLASLNQWREQWRNICDEYLQRFLRDSSPSQASLAPHRNRLLTALKVKFPERFKKRRLKNPAFFHGRDLTPFDVLTLGDKFIEQFPDRDRRIVLVGLRTAGSYFAPLLRAYLNNHEYKNIDVVTMRPRSVLGWGEREHLERSAREKRTAVILDESPIGGGTTAGVVKHLRRMGYPEERIVALLPVHRLYREWKKGWNAQNITKTHIVTLNPEEWQQYKSLAPEPTQKLLREYFIARGYRSATVISSVRADRFNAYLQSCSDEKYHTRFKRIHEVSLQKADGEVETRYVLAKSVGWGWLSYHAFLAAERLSRFVPPVLGLRNGFLFTEWRPEAETIDPAKLNGQLGDIASYIAARASVMALSDDPTRDLLLQKQHRGSNELLNMLGRAYSSRTVRALLRPRIQRTLARRVCPRPTFIDAKMHPAEWIAGPASILKTDFEHHGMGKVELEVTDPAYDLADVILHFKLPKVEEENLINTYVEQSGDTTVRERLFLNKLLAGGLAMMQATANIKDLRLLHKIQESNQQYLDASNFLMVHTMRLCAEWCLRPKKLAWQAAMVVLDVDGVLDTPVFGFPSTSAAGIRAISLLHSHNYVVALNTARCASELKEYCRNYGFVGGVGEYGSVLWDEVAQQERVLVSSEALAQLETLRKALQTLPGVFLNGDYRYSIRAYTFGSEQTAPLPILQIRNLMANLKLDKLRVHQTGIDTAIIATEVDKGTGLIELVARAGVKDSDAIAIGDSDPDLAMFRVAGRSFAPSHIWCRTDAEKLGCRIAKTPYQSGLLESVWAIVHSNGRRCDRCRTCDSVRPSDDLIFSLLEAADQKRTKLLAKAILDPLAWRAFA